MANREPFVPVADEVDTVDIIVAALRQKFGVNAIAVALRQIECASDATVQVWREVIVRLSR